MGLSEKAKTHRQEQAREYMRETRKSPEKQAQEKAWRQANPERQRAAQSRWYQKNKERILKEQKTIREGYRETFFELYGWVCSCCAESIVSFLTMDHKDGNNRQGVWGGNGELRRAIKTFRPDLWQTLCFNCNCGRATNGGVCPHNKTGSVLYGI